MCRADSYAEIGDYKRALHDVTRAIILHPDDRHLYLRRGQLLLQLGDLNLAGFCVRHISTFGEVWFWFFPLNTCRMMSFFSSIEGYSFHFSNSASCCSVFPKKSWCCDWRSWCSLSCETCSSYVCTSGENSHESEKIQGKLNSLTHNVSLHWYISFVVGCDFQL